MLKKSISLCFGVTLSPAQVLLLHLQSVITPWGTTSMLGIKPRLSVCKAATQPLKKYFQNKLLENIHWVYSYIPNRQEWLDKSSCRKVIQLLTEYHSGITQNHLEYKSSTMNIVSELTYCPSFFVLKGVCISLKCKSKKLYSLFLFSLSNPIKFIFYIVLCPSSIKLPLWVPLPFLS